MNLFSFVKSQLSILDVIGEYTKLKKAGTYWKAHCPFHHEKTASFTVSPHREIFYCFGCHMGGDLISFIAKVENCTQLEAAQHLVERYQLEVPEAISKAPSQDPDEKNRYFQLCETVSLWCHDGLKKSPSILHYLNNRGFNSQTIDLFKIGYFPGGLRHVKSLIAHVRTKSILTDDLLEAKIISEGRNILYSPFEERIIFPIKDHLGRFCGFGGRIFKRNDQRAKYYNSHENNFFNKGSILFGLDLAKKSIQEKEELFLVEGYTDCIAMVQHGFANTVATLGTSCTAHHLKMLSRYAHQLYVLYDGDAAGQKAIMRLTELCWQVSMELKVIQLPEGEDPASFLRSGGNIKTEVDQAKNIFSFFVSNLGEGFAEKSLNKKIQLVKKLIGTIKNIPEPVKRDIILKNASKTLEIPFESLYCELEKQLNKKNKKEAESSEKPKVVQAPNNSEKAGISLEKRILFAILNNVSFFNEDNEDYLITCLSAPSNSILQKLLTLKKQPSTDPLTFSRLFELLDERERQYASMTLLQIDETVTAQSFHHMLRQLQKKTWKNVVQNIKNKLALAQQENNVQEVENILSRFSRLKKKLLKNSDMKVTSKK